MPNLLLVREKFCYSAGNVNASPSDSLYALSRHGKIEEGWVACFCKKTGDYYPCKSIESSQAEWNEDWIMGDLAGKENIGIKGVFCKENEPVHIVMECCTGQRLSEGIGNRQYSETYAAKLTKIIVGVIKICHEAKVTLGNCLEKTFIFTDESEDSTLKAVYFGSAKRLDELKEGKEKKKKKMERDIQSAGKILYALVTGERLSEDDQKGIIKGKGPKSSGETSRKCQGVSEGPESSGETSRKWQDVSEGAKSLIQKMLRKDPLTATDVLGDEWICTNGRELDEDKKTLLKKVTQNLEAIKIGEKPTKQNRQN